MKVYVQSKSGDFNTVLDVKEIGTLEGVFKRLRYTGSYPAEYRDKEVQVPFEQIQYIRKAGEND